MAEDKHLGTGEYDPEKYWNARAEASDGSALKAVCVFRASDRENETAHRVQARAIQKALRQVDLKGKNVLEYGCGVGRWVPFFKALGAVWHGVDISNDMLSIAGGEHDGVDLRKVKGNKIPHQDSTMDLIYSITVVHHNSYDAQEGILAEMARVVKGGGHLLLLEDIIGEESFNMFPRSEESWVGLAGRHGFSLIRREGIIYWIFRTFIHKANRKMGALLFGKPRSGDKQEAPGSQGFLRRLVNYMDMIIDPYLYPIIPGRHKTTAIFLFRKTG